MCVCVFRSDKRRYYIIYEWLYIYIIYRAFRDRFSRKILYQKLYLYISHHTFKNNPEQQVEMANGFIFAATSHTFIYTYIYIYTSVELSGCVKRAIEIGPTMGGLRRVLSERRIFASGFREGTTERAKKKGLVYVLLDDRCDELKML